MSVSKTYLAIIKKADENYKTGNIDKKKLEVFIENITGIFVAFSDGKQDAPQTLKEFQRQLDIHGII